MTNEALWTTVIVLVGGYWVQLIYRLHKAEAEIAELRRDLSRATTQVAVATANALAAAAQALAAKK